MRWQWLKLRFNKVKRLTQPQDKNLRGSRNHLCLLMEVNSDARWTPGSRSRCTPQWNPAKNTAAAYGWTIKFGEPSSFDSAILGALYHVVPASLSRHEDWFKCNWCINWGHQSGGLEIPDAKLQTLRRNSRSNESIRLANFRNYMFVLLHVTADRFLKLTIRGVPQGDLNNIILFPAFYPKFKFPYYTLKILNFHLKEVFLCFQV